jgi:hypothetical protein
MENQNENQLCLENADVGLDVPGFELDERFGVGLARLSPGRRDLNCASSDRRSRAAPGLEVVARGGPPHLRTNRTSANQLRHIDRGIRRHLRCRDACGFISGNFAT